MQFNLLYSCQSEFKSDKVGFNPDISIANGALVGVRVRVGTVGAAGIRTGRRRGAARQDNTSINMNTVTRCRALPHRISGVGLDLMPLGYLLPG